jgi:hypothetical protein
LTLTRLASLGQNPRPMPERDENFEKRMKQAESEVAREFGALDPELVRREFARVSGDLLRTATVTDFVPVLVHRHVRENLKLAELSSA